MSHEGVAAILAILLIIGLLSIVLVIASYLVMSWFVARVFVKAGIPAWKAWVPVYSNWILLELGRQPGWWSILLLVPFVNYAAIVFVCIAVYRVSQGFGKEAAGFLVLYIFVPWVWAGIIAFDDSRWEPWRVRAFLPPQPV
ncbi:DUF5684 domain-containing protein [Compostimonas suwonensis]|uniref:Signal peptidase I n=1 Tax=Compostimonas suwonensis TaxID=1048394 RepID=A0A2M9BUE2_9MICO|nr:DUF5684 domain-containing protein [Compostimonas suwonensis]PJJ61578.1 hypothetical protein CLV54_2524 [Compostimonas suwonensis]